MPDDEHSDLSRRFRAAYTAALLGGIALTGLSSILVQREANRLQDRLVDPDDPVIAEMIRSTWVRAGATVTLLLLLWQFLLRPMADHLASERARLREAEQVQQAASARQELSTQVHEALDMADDEPAVTRVVARALARIAPDLPSELLLADSSRAHMHQAAANPVAGAPGCAVTTPNRCPAVRRGRTTVFTSSSDINACPHLVDRPDGACSAVCVPVSSMGRNLGVLHVAGPDGEPPAMARTDGLTMVATQAGVRIDGLRSVARMQLQASTDGLTGLANRRATEELVGRMLRSGPSIVALAMIDLDHFKRLNDKLGHEAGDRALRTFADVARRSLRDEDVLGRWGGEEFVLALPGLDRHAAVAVLDRIREALAEAGSRAELPELTASFGVADSDLSRELDELVQLADEALLVAKARGRNRVVVGPAVADPDHADAVAPRGV